MKVTLDLDALLAEREISQDEYDRLSTLSIRSTGSLAYNLLIGFGVVAISGASIALFPEPETVVGIGLGILLFGGTLLRMRSEVWLVLANISLLVGAMMAGGGFVFIQGGSLGGLLLLALLFVVIGVFARSALLVVLATLTLSASIGARTGYFHASYFLVIQEPLITVAFFSLLAIGLYHLFKKLSADYQRLAIISSRTAVLLVNFGFWVGSLWGEQNSAKEVVISDSVFSIFWAAALLVTAIWSWRKNRVWVLNTVAVFGGIHLYTQWFEYFGASPNTILIAGLLVLAAALSMKHINRKNKYN
jgi:iron complex transport system permease protein